MKDDVKVKVPNEISKILILSNGVVNYDRVLKYGGSQRVTMQRIFKVGWKDLLHKIQSENVHKQMIQTKGDL
jgi:hypothetical protein